MKVIVVGGGAAGLTSAIFAAQRGVSVKILERNRETGKKILVSGGTRCNVLPGSFQPSIKNPCFFSSAKPQRVTTILNMWPLDQIHGWMGNDLGLDLVQELETGKWFPKDNSARQVRDALLHRAQSLGVSIDYNARVCDIQKDQNRFNVMSQDKTYEADQVILSTGGFSYPALGTDGDGHRMLKKLGQNLVPVFPALTPLHGPHPSDVGLQGISLPVDIVVKSGNKQIGHSHSKGFLFTHKGFSGPAILDLSHLYITAEMNHQPPVQFLVNWGAQEPQFWETLLTNTNYAKKLIHNVLQIGGLPSRLADALCQLENLSEVALSHLRADSRKRLISLITEYPLKITGHAGYNLAEVTGGGLPLDLVKTSTMESLQCPGLFLCGEIFDVFGRIGGYNFQWAWVTGKLAGENVGKQQ